jgi:hypothetical protein
MHYVFLTLANNLHNELLQAFVGRKESEAWAKLDGGKSKLRQQNG